MSYSLSAFCLSAVLCHREMQNRSPIVHMPPRQSAFQVFAYSLTYRPHPFPPVASAYTYKPTVNMSKLIVLLPAPTPRPQYCSLYAAPPPVPHCTTSAPSSRSFRSPSPPTVPVTPVSTNK
eukprot:GFKZ01015306.1.p2 GENE.GFKZ01015306.1~~GFKZ01015306.1.p2  ORF type:complete len:121 (+),score=3.84 GFKZ01015306.1:880-1242(+)